MGFLKKAYPLGCHQPIADIGDYAPGDEMCWFGAKGFEMSNTVTLTVEIAFKGPTI